MWRSVNETLSDFCSSAFWRNDLTWNTPNPTFTVCFEKTILTWLPCAFLWLFAPLEIYYLCRSSVPDRIPFNVRSVTKLMLIAILGATVVVEIVNYLIKNDTRNVIDIYSSVFKFLSLILFFGLTYANIKCDVKSSGVLFVFSFLLALCGALQLFTLQNSWHSHILHESIVITHGGKEIMKDVSHILYYPLVLVVLLLNCFADSSPKSKTEPIKYPWPEYESSFLSKIFLTWLDKFVWKVYKDPSIADDLWDLSDQVPTEQITKRLESKWHFAPSGLLKTTKIGKRVSILRPLLEIFAPSFILGLVYRMFHSVLKFSGPQILWLILAFVRNENELSWHGLFYVFLLLTVAILQMLFFNCHWRVIYRIALQIRTALVSMIYKKVLKISNGARKTFTHGEMVSLMAVDVQRLSEFMYSFPFLCACPLEICFSVYCLWNILGPCVLAGVALLIILIIINSFTTSRIRKLQMIQMRHKSKRVGFISEILSGMKVLKLYASEACFEKQISRIRDEEIVALKRLAYFQAVSSFTWIFTPFLVSYVTFSIYVLSSEKNVFNPDVVFVSLSLFNIMKTSTKVLPNAVKAMVQAHVAIGRINSFLNSEDLDPNVVSHEQCAEAVVIECGEFSWENHEGSPTLTSININVKPDHLVAIVGAVGSGKSSLLSAILGEMYKKSGSVNTTGRLAYVPQQAWILHASIKDNITLGEMNTPFYNVVLEACALIADLEILFGGDQTIIGEKGVNLSGGQKQRISLARAVYSDADIYLLDDPLSAVDAHVCKHIFDKVIGPNGLLKNKTRILVTHNVRYLPLMDNIIVLQNGVISESGTYTELLQKGGDFARFLSSYVGNDRENILAENEPKNADESDRKQHSQRYRSCKKSIAKSERKIQTIGHSSIENKEALVENVATWKVYGYYLNAIGPFMTSVTILTNILCQVSVVASKYWLSAWSWDTNSSGVGTHNAAAKLSKYMLVYALFGAGQATSVIVHTIALYTGSLKAAKCLHNRLLKSIFHWPVTVFDTIPSGRIINRFASDIYLLDNVLPTSMQGFLTYKAIVLSTLFVISYNTPLFLCVLLPLGAIYYFFQRIYAAASKQLKRLEFASRSPMYSHFGSTIWGVQSIRAYGLQKKFIKMLEDRVDINLKRSYAGIILRRWFGLRLDILGAIIVFAASLFAVLGRNVIGAALVGLSITYALEVTSDLYWCTRMFTDMEMNMVAVERIKEYCELEQETPWILAEVPENWPSRGEIEFRNFRMQYREDTELVLKGINFKVNAGEKVGIVGRTGAGKSSLVLSLFRIIECTGGSIFIDGVDISKIGLHSLRSQLTIIPQDPVLFSGTLRMNLDLEGKYLDEEIWRALELANLKAYVSDLDAGLLYQIKEGGSNFSAGQRQLLCLARALLRKSKVLILDEATAAIDFATEDSIRTTIREEFKHSTVLTIAHRLNTVLDYDRILVLDKGEIVAFSSPSALLSSKQSLFHSMVVAAGLACKLKSGNN